MFVHEGGVDCRAEDAKASVVDTADDSKIVYSFSVRRGHDRSARRIEQEITTGQLRLLTLPYVVLSSRQKILSSDAVQSPSAVSGGVDDAVERTKSS